MKRFLRNDMSKNRDGWFGGSRAPTNTPMSVGEEYKAKIEDVNRQANTGIDNIEDFVNLVNASPEERVMVRIVKVGTGDAGPKS